MSIMEILEAALDKISDDGVISVAKLQSILLGENRYFGSKGKRIYITKDYIWDVVEGARATLGLEENDDNYITVKELVPRIDLLISKVLTG